MKRDYIFNCMSIAKVEFARKLGNNTTEKDYYEANAKRLITTWGGDPVNDYSGRV